MSWRRLAWLLPIAGGLFIGCLHGDELPVEEDLDEAWQEEAPERTPPSSPTDVGEPVSAAAVQPQAVDVAVCRSLAQLEQRCFADEPPTIDLEECAQRYACSRQLWRMDAEAVHACVRRRPCDDHDPVMSCLEQVGSQVKPSAAAQRFERVFAQTRQSCEDVVEVAPGLSDVVYDMLGACLTDNDSCEAKAACSEAMLGELLDEICGPAEPPAPEADEGILL